MKNSNAFLVAASLILLAGSALRAETAKCTREFRPLEAKKVVFSPAAKVASNGIDSLLTAAWRHFDEREWDQAIDRFLAVMEEDAKNASAAEGLAMSVYRMGDYNAANRLSVEFATFMPEISGRIADIVLADVRYLIGKGENAEARELLNYFPKRESAFTQAHTLVEGAEALARNLGPDEETPSPRLAKN